MVDNTKLKPLNSDSRKSRNRRNKKSSAPSRGKIYGSAATQLASDVRYLYSMLNVEDKYVDASATAIASSTTATFSLLNPLSLGNTANTRMGNSVKFLKLTFSFYCSVSSVAVTSIERILIVLDTQTNGAIFTIADLLQNTAAAYAVISPRVPENVERYRVLLDKSYALVYTGENALVIGAVDIEMSRHAKYYSGSNTGLVADYETSSIYLIHICNQAVNTNTITWFSRCYYVDN